jgi:hypothetical protein
MIFDQSYLPDVTHAIQREFLSATQSGALMQAAFCSSPGADVHHVSGKLRYWAKVDARALHLEI